MICIICKSDCNVYYSQIFTPSVLSSCFASWYWFRVSFVGCSVVMSYAFSKGFPFGAFSKDMLSMYFLTSSLSISLAVSLFIFVAARPTSANSLVAMGDTWFFSANVLAGLGPPLMLLPETTAAKAIAAPS